MSIYEKVKKNISMVFPAYFDEKNISKIVEKSIKALREIAGEFEIIIVEDGSPDSTGYEADLLSKKYDFVRALHHKKNEGHGAAIKTGMKEAKYELVVLMDGDGQYEPEDMKKMLVKMETCDLVQGRRIAYPNGVMRYYFSKIYNLSLRIMLKSRLRDLGCSIKMVRKEIIEDIWPQSNGIFAQGELVMRAVKKGYRVDECDVLSYPRESGKSNSMKLRNIMIMIDEIKVLKKRLKLEK